MAESLNRGRSRIVCPTRTPAQARGDAAEAMAERFMAQQGLTTIARNVRCRGGEVDLICTNRDTVVFVEVRLRSGTRFGGAAESITARKQARVIMAARWWLAGDGRRFAGLNCRFDAILLDSLEAPQINWIPDAFDAGGA